MSSQQGLALLRAQGRCVAALIFSIFGAVWLLLACAYSHHFRWPIVLLIGLVAGMIARQSWRLQAKIPPPTLDQPLEARKQREGRLFGIINAVTWGAVLLLFIVLPRFGLQNYIFPAFIALVGLHLFPLPPLYQHPSNLVLGTFLTVWAVFCAVAFRHNGYTMTTFVTLGAGLALWCNSLWAIRTAARLAQAALPPSSLSADLS